MLFRKTPESTSVGYLFGEGQGRYLLAIAPDEHDIFRGADVSSVPLRSVGVAGGNALELPGLFSVPLERLRAAHEGWLPAYMGEPA